MYPVYSVLPLGMIHLWCCCVFPVRRVLCAISFGVTGGWCLSGTTVLCWFALQSLLAGCVGSTPLIQGASVLFLRRFSFLSSFWRYLWGDVWVVSGWRAAFIGRLTPLPKHPLLVLVTSPVAPAVGGIEVRMLTNEVAQDC